MLSLTLLIVIRRGVVILFIALKQLHHALVVPYVIGCFSILSFPLATPLISSSYVA